MFNNESAFVFCPKHNSFFMTIEPLEDAVSEAITKENFRKEELRKKIIFYLKH